MFRQAALAFAGFADATGSRRMYYGKQGAVGSEQGAEKHGSYARE